MRSDGSMVYGWQGQTKRGGSPAQTWCGRHGFQTTMQLNIGMGEEAAQTLAHAWAHRMQWLFDASNEGLLETKEERGRAVRAYSEAEPQDFQELMRVGNDDVMFQGRRARALQL